MVATAGADVAMVVVGRETVAKRVANAAGLVSQVGLEERRAVTVEMEATEEGQEATVAGAGEGAKGTGLLAADWVEAAADRGTGGCWESPGR